MIELKVLGNESVPLNVVSSDTIPLEVTMSTGGQTIHNQNKSVTPTESSQSVTADTGYTGLGTVTVGAISSDYVGSDVPRKTSSDLTASGATVTAPSGYYSESASKSVASGSVTPSASKGTVSNHSVDVTPSVTATAGWVNAGTTTGTAVSVSASELVSGTKSITANGTGIDVTNYASVDVAVSGGITPTGTIPITSNGIVDVTNYASANVNVPNSYSASDEGKVVSNGALVSQTSDTVTANDTYDTTLINSLTVNVSGGSAMATDYVNANLTNVDISNFEWTMNGGKVYANNITKATNVTVYGATEVNNITPNAGITGVLSLPDVTTIGTNAWTGASFPCKVVYCPKMSSIGSGFITGANQKILVKLVVAGNPWNHANSLRNSPQLKAVVLKVSSVPSLSQASAVTNSGIGQNADGYIYVPRSLVNSFKADTNWSAFSSKFRAIEDYPLVDAPDDYIPT